MRAYDTGFSSLDPAQAQGNPFMRAAMGGGAQVKPTHAHHHHVPIGHNGHNGHNGHHQHHYPTQGIAHHPTQQPQFPQAPQQPQTQTQPQRTPFNPPDTPKDDRTLYPCDVTQYKLCGVIGEGSNGTVYKAWCRPLDSYVAIKVINLDVADFNLRTFGYELSTMALCKHKNILEFKRAFVYHEQLWVVLPYVRYGSIADVIKADHPNGFDNEPFVASVLQQTLEGLDYLHTKCHQVHRDVKAANLLLSDDGVVKICDFGVVGNVKPTEPLSEVLEKKEKATQRQVGGSPCWMAPEVITEFLRQGADQATLSQLGLTSLPALGTPIHPDPVPVYHNTTPVEGTPVPTPQPFNHQYPPTGTTFPQYPGHTTQVPYGVPQPSQPQPVQGGVYNPYLVTPGVGVNPHGVQQPAAAYPYGTGTVPQVKPISPLPSGVGAMLSHVQPPVQSVPRPPVFTGESAAADVWSFGVTVLEVLLGKPPYHRHTPMKVFSLTLSSAPPTLKALNHKKYERFSKEMAAFIDFCLNKNPTKRPTVDLLLQQDVFRRAEESISTALQQFELKLSEIKAIKKKKKKKRLQKGEKEKEGDDDDDAEQILPEETPQSYCDIEWDFPEASDSEHIEQREVADVFPVCADAVASVERIPTAAASVEDTHLHGHAHGGAWSCPDARPTISSTLPAANGLITSLFSHHDHPTARSGDLLPVACSLGSRNEDPPHTSPRYSSWEDPRSLPTPASSLQEDVLTTRVEEEEEAVDGAIVKIAVCPACLREPDDGRRLECGHCVCLVCLEQSYSFKTEMYTLLKATSGLAFGKPGDLILCPQCSHPTHLRKGRKSIPLADLPKGVIKTQICDHCEENVSEVHCHQCQVTLCGGCSAELHKRGRFKNHKTDPLHGAHAVDSDEGSQPDSPEHYYDSTASSHTSTVGRSASRSGLLRTNLSYIEDYRMSDEDLLASLRKRHTQLGNSLEVLHSKEAEDNARVKQTTADIESWSKDAREALARHEKALLLRIGEKDGQRRSTMERQRKIVTILRAQIDTTLRSLEGHLAWQQRQRLLPVKETEGDDEPEELEDGLNPVHIFRATSLLATPCASDPQLWAFDFRASAPVFPKISSLAVSTSQLMWTVPPGPFTEISARAVVVLAAAVLCMIFLSFFFHSFITAQSIFGTQNRYTKLRTRPEGIPQVSFFCFFSRFNTSHHRRVTGVCGRWWCSLLQAQQLLSTRGGSMRRARRKEASRSRLLSREGAGRRLWTRQTTRGWSMTAATKTWRRLWFGRTRTARYGKKLSLLSMMYSHPTKVGGVKTLLDDCKMDVGLSSSSGVPRHCQRALSSKFGDFQSNKRVKKQHITNSTARSTSPLKG